MPVSSPVASSSQSPALPLSASPAKASRSSSTTTTAPSPSGILQLQAIDGPHRGEIFSFTAADEKESVMITYKRKRYVQLEVGRSDDADVSLNQDECVSEE